MAITEIFTHSEIDPFDLSAVVGRLDNRPRRDSDPMDSMEIAYMLRSLQSAPDLDSYWPVEIPLRDTFSRIARFMTQFSGLERHQPEFQIQLGRALADQPEGQPTELQLLQPVVDELLTNPKVKAQYLGRMCFGENPDDNWQPVSSRETEWLDSQVHSLEAAGYEVRPRADAI